ncbi:hypothetical protein PENSPDRAFT_650958 [Peniophora sp. CONT]|nr:hypothetical protein PENSPDRAFT_650958 [Peniophora sp. CONT]
MARVLLAAALAATSLASALELPGPIASHCAFTLGERQYDLCPLFSSAVDGLGGKGQKTVEYRYATKEIESEIVYQYNLSLGGPLQRNDSEDEQCEEGTWVCMTTITRSPESSPEARQHVPIVRSGSSSVYTDVYEQDDGLVVVMSGEPYAGQRMRALIAFECSTEEGDLELAVSGSPTHAFTWRTPHACSTHLPSSTLTSSSADEPQRGRGDHEHHQHPPSDPSNPTKTKPDQNLLPPVNDHITLRTVFIVLLASFASFGLIYYGVTHPPAWAKPYLRAVGKKMRRLRKWRGRPGESRLLRWAEEELPTFGLDEDDAYSEEDEMVNARAQAEMGLDVEEGERMPLKPSMLFSAAAPGKKGYGTYGA